LEVGVIIAFCGIDGSGKTTFSEISKEVIAGKGLNVVCRHNIKNSFYHSILHNVIGKLSKGAKGSLEKGLREKRRGLTFFVSSWIKAGMLLLNLIIFNCRYGSYKGSAGRNIICDRYFYDDLVQMEYLGWKNKIFPWFYKRCIIIPDLLFFLDTQSEAAFSRKKEYDLDYFVRKSELYRNLFKDAAAVNLPDLQMDKRAGIVRSRVSALWEAG
jgi:thymidylate kinase